MSCSHRNDKHNRPVPAAQRSDGVSCYLDSSWIGFFLSKSDTGHKLHHELFLFYQKRNYLAAWIHKGGINENAGNFINLLNNEQFLKKSEEPASLPELQALFQEALKKFRKIRCHDSLALKLEVLLTLNFFKYASRNWGGVSDDVLKQVNWFIVRKQINYERLLSDFLNSTHPAFINEPVYRQYSLLKNHLQKYYEIDLIGGWLPPSEGEYKLKKGDSLEIIASVKQQLYVMEDLAAMDSTRLFDDTLETGVKRFQRRHGLKEDGIIGGKTLQAMRVTIQDRIYQILVNMERCRWVPLEPTGDYIVVNIPQFQLHAFRNNLPDWSCNVIVGKSNSVNNTIIFNDSIEHIVFNPYWNIPKNILVKETLPAIKKDNTYFQKNNLEVVDHTGKAIATSDINWNEYSDHFPYIIRERPGKNNSLGSIKFLFPNPYDIYMHDTPARSLFREPNRTFSHGCIRLEEPLKLARFLLKADTVWGGKTLTSVMSSGKETFVRLKKKIPVFIAYFTCWVDETGKVNFREDVYGHDAKMKTLLFVN